MKRLLVSVLLLLLLCGCTTTYKLEISNINIVFEKNEDEDIETIDPVTGEKIESDNQIDSLLEADTYALFSKNSKYKKKIKKHDNYIDVNMKYTYSEKTFEDSNSLKLCFENAVFRNEKNYYIHAKGKFYCLYSDSMDIEIYSNNKVVSNNADEVNGNSYIWHINENNVDNVEIEFEVEKGFSKVNIIYITSILLFLVIGVIVYKISKNKRLINNSI